MLQRSARRPAILAVAALLVLGGLAQPGAHGAGRTNPQITVEPTTGLTDGQTVVVTGSGFQGEQGINIIECGAEVFTPPFRGAICGDYFVGLKTDADGNFGPVNFTVTTTITGSRWEKGQYIPATHTCAPTDDCYVHVYTTTRAARAVNQHLGF